MSHSTQEIFDNTHVVFLSQMKLSIWGRTAGCAYCLRTHARTINKLSPQQLLCCCCCDGSVGVFLETTFDKCPVHCLHTPVTHTPWSVPMDLGAAADIHNASTASVYCPGLQNFANKERLVRRYLTVNNCGPCSRGRGGLVFFWMPSGEMWGTECQHSSWVSVMFRMSALVLSSECMSLYLSKCHRREN